MELLGTPRRRQLLENIWQRASLSKQQFEEIYRRPLANYAELVQQLPASENHHHAHPGGMIDHGLEIVAYALKVRQTYLLPIAQRRSHSQPRLKPGRPPRLMAPWLTT
ncbi:hypothetical protein BH77_11570 [Pseudomonas aeruginosa C2773C]|nr:hypothetical protein BH77_11570 [Pseudomonas aeruginosa C2773C]